MRPPDLSKASHVLIQSLANSRAPMGLYQVATGFGYHGGSGRVPLSLSVISPGSTRTVGTASSRPYGFGAGWTLGRFWPRDWALMTVVVDPSGLSPGVIRARVRFSRVDRSAGTNWVSAPRPPLWCVEEPRFLYVDRSGHRPVGAGRIGGLIAVGQPVFEPSPPAVVCPTLAGERTPWTGEVACHRLVPHRPPGSTKQDWFRNRTCSGVLRR
jgi:hypothetical protein